MQKPIIIALIVALVCLLLFWSIIVWYDWQLRQWITVFVIAAVAVIWLWARIYYARDQRDIFDKDFLIGIGALVMICFFFACSLQEWNQVIWCHRHCHIMIESDFWTVFWKAFVGIVFVYSGAFVLQLPEKEWVKK
jgi:hypothetical protein